jgi:hypothetical protein
MGGTSKGSRSELAVTTGTEGAMGLSDERKDSPDESFPIITMDFSTSLST